MFLCSDLSEAGVCLEWVEHTSIFMLPEGSGMEIGGALLLCSVTAWGISLLARMLLNR